MAFAKSAKRYPAFTTITRSAITKPTALGQAEIAFMAAEPPPLPVTYTTPTGETAIVEESFLSRKYMGIPVWGWGVLAVALLVGIPLLRKHKSSKRARRR